MIEKILDNYYSNKVIEVIKLAIYSTSLFVDIKIKKTKDRIIIYIKRDKFKDIQYRQIFMFYKRYSFEAMTKQKELRKLIESRTIKYLEVN